MTLSKYESLLEKVKKNWSKYDETMKWWTRERLKELAKEIK